MKYMKKAEKLAEELAKVLIHNKYLLDNETDLKLVIECRFINGMGEAFRDGMESTISSDMSHLCLNVGRGEN